MRRRAVLLGFGAALLARDVMAQSSSRRPRVGFFLGGYPGSPDGKRFLGVFTQAMAALGYRDGENYSLAVRHYSRNEAAIPALADELIAWQADVLVANVSSTAAVLVRKTTTIPIVMVNAVDAVAEGLVKSLARPGGNVTGMTAPGAVAFGKLVELTRDLLPRARRIAFLFNPRHALSKSYSAVAAHAAKRLELDWVTLDVTGAADMDRFSAELRAAKADALVVATDAVLFGLRDPIVRAANEAHLPTVAYLHEFAASGAVACLGWDLALNYRGAAGYVDRILKGAKPADLPVEMPSQFELVINLKSAAAMKIKVPPTLLARADRVIE